MAEKHSTRQTSDPFIRRHRTFFVGLFAIIPIVVIPGLLLYTLAKSEVLQGWCRLHVLYDQSYGLGNGNQVTISGMSIGHVTSIALVREGCINVTFKINRRYRQFVRKDTGLCSSRKTSLSATGRYSLPAAQKTRRW